MRSHLPLLPLLALLALPMPAAAQTGGVEYRDDGAVAPGEVPVPAEAPAPQTEDDKQSATDGPAPVLEAFSVSARRVYSYGRPSRVSFRIDSGAPSVSVSLRLTRSGGGEPRVLELGSRPTGTTITYNLAPRTLPAGTYTVEIDARDGAGRGLRRRAKAASSTQVTVYSHRFPLAGPFTYPGPDGRFGAPRSSHSHGGQDLTAGEGVPVVAPRGGTVKTVAYQAEGAGHYVILDGAGEDLDYAFFHLQAGSIKVREGQRVRTGQRLAGVGNTGRSFGAHLHFEVWRGTWFGGGKAIDPLPLLRRWDAWS